MWQDLEDLDKKIESLRGKVNRAVRPVEASARELITIMSQEISFVEDDMTERSATFYNGSPDAYVFRKLSVAVTMQVPPEASVPLRFGMNRYAFGYMRRTQALPFIPVPRLFGMFDFTWNYLINSRQSAYSRNNVGSPLFNGVERGQLFDLYEPLIIKPVDSVQFFVKPTMYALPGTPEKFAGTTYYVNIMAFGYRRPL